MWSCCYISVQNLSELLSLVHSQDSSHTRPHSPKPSSPPEIYSFLPPPEICFLWLLARMAPFHPLEHRWNFICSRNTSLTLPSNWVLLFSFTSLCYFLHIMIYKWVCVFMCVITAGQVVHINVLKCRLQGRILVCLCLAPCLLTPGLCPILNVSHNR